MADLRNFACTETLRNGLAVTIRALRADDRERIAHAVRQLDRDSTAELAFVVEEDYQGLGIAGRVLKHLAGIAREKRIAALEVDVRAENKSMLAVFARSGLPMRQRRDGSVIHVTLALKPASG